MYCMAVCRFWWCTVTVCRILVMYCVTVCRILVVYCVQDSGDVLCDCVQDSGDVLCDCVQDSGDVLCAGFRVRHSGVLRGRPQSAKLEACVHSSDTRSQGSVPGGEGE